MGFHKYSSSRNMKIPKAHLEPCGNEVWGVLKMNFKNDASRFRYCFIGERKGELYYDDVLIENHPKFTGIGKFESWVSRYKAEHDI